MEQIADLDVKSQDEKRLQLAFKRFWSRVRIDGSCWIWTGAKLGRGYGHHWDGKKQISAHRFMYEITHGPVPPDLYVCHKCDNPPCVNPLHLYAATPSENQVYSMRKPQKRGRRKWNWALAID